jgi:hypothetical protein
MTFFILAAVGICVFYVLERLMRDFPSNWDYPGERDE